MKSNVWYWIEVVTYCLLPSRHASTNVLSPKDQDTDFPRTVRSGVWPAYFLLINYNDVLLCLYNLSLLCYDVIYCVNGGSVDGHLPCLAACCCSWLSLKVVLVFTELINFFLSAAAVIRWRSLVVSFTACK